MMHRNTQDTQEIHPWFPLFKISSWISIRRGISNSGVLGLQDFSDRPPLII